jgi:hypothetical protein
MEDMEYEAVAKADDVVRLTQPSDRDTDQAPMYKNTPQAMRALLQFTQSLNVIWQNLRYDNKIPGAIREGRALQLAGCYAGYVLAGVSLMLLTEGLGGDDDDKEQRTPWQRRLLFHSFTQFTDAVPFVGDAVAKAWEAAVTGRVQWSGGDNLFPAAKEAGLAVASLAKAAYKRGDGEGKAAETAAVNALEHFMAGLAYFLGLPLSGGKELGRAFGLDPWDGDWEPGFNPGAFAGRR